jgi:glucose/arabinose dehydrogenase
MSLRKDSPMNGYLPRFNNLSVTVVYLLCLCVGFAAADPVPLRSDIQIRKILDTGGNFVRIALDPLTHDLHYMNGNGSFYRLDLQPGTESKGTRVYTSSDIGVGSSTLGMAFGPDGTLYVVGNISRGSTTQAVIRKGVPDALGVRIWSTLVSTVPYPKSNTAFDHLFNGIVVSPDGRYVYINSGSRTDHGEVESNNGVFPDTREVPLTSAIFRIPTDSTDLVLPNDEAELLKVKRYLFADGTRNTFDLEFASNGDLFGTENGPDADYPEELNWLREGHHYGFPWRFGDYDNPQRFSDYDPSQDRRLQKDFTAVKNGTYRNDPTFPPPPMAFTDPVVNLGPNGDQYRDADGSQKDAGDEGQPIYTFTPHRSPFGLTFDQEKALSAEFRGDAFVLSWGAAGGTLTDRGQDLLHLKLTKVGDTYQVQATQIVKGFDHPIDAVLLKNKLYVLDYGGPGAIWEVILPEVEEVVMEVDNTESPDTGQSLPISTALLQNYPNPFNTQTTIYYRLTQTLQVELSIHDMMGRKVVTLVDGVQRPGIYAAVWDGHDRVGQEIASGVYLYRLSSRGYQDTRRLILLK